VSQPPTALHRALAWCAVVLFLALVAVGTRSALRGLRPEPAPESEPQPSVAPTLRDVDVSTRDAVAEAATTSAEDLAPAPLVFRDARRALFAPGQEPMERHPACVIEGSVRSLSGALRQPVELQVDHPNGGTARTRLYFDRATDDGQGRLAVFKLVKPAGGTYVLRPVVQGDFDYAVEPPVWRIGDSMSGVDFVVRDDVPHVDLDVVALGAGGEELAARLQWHVYREAEIDIDDLIFGGLRTVELELDRGPELRRVPVSNALQCFLTAPGHRPHRVVRDLFAGDQRLEASLEPGWGIYLVDMGVRAIRPSQEAPTGEIHVDGRRIGFTAPSGVTYVEASAVPQEFAVYYGARRAALLREVPTDRLVVTIDHNLLEPDGFAPRPSRD
jgi:hypothetical protein